MLPLLPKRVLVSSKLVPFAGSNVRGIVCTLSLFPSNILMLHDWVVWPYFSLVPNSTFLLPEIHGIQLDRLKNDSSTSRQDLHMLIIPSKGLSGFFAMDGDTQKLPRSVPVPSSSCTWKPWPTSVSNPLCCNLSPLYSVIYCKESI